MAKDIIPIESLQPVSKSDPRIRVPRDMGEAFHHGAPATRRVKPKPFARETISIQVPGEPTLSWQDTRAGEVLIGYVVVDVGRVAERRRQPRYVSRQQAICTCPGPHADCPWLGQPVPFEDIVDCHCPLHEHPELILAGDVGVAVGTDIVLTNVLGEEHTFDIADTVQAFRPDPAEGGG